MSGQNGGRIQQKYNTDFRYEQSNFSSAVFIFPKSSITISADDKSCAPESNTSAIWGPSWFFCFFGHPPFGGFSTLLSFSPTVQ